MIKENLFSSKLTRRETHEFEMHVKSSMKRAYFSALGFVGSHDLAVELSQQAFIRAYRNYKSFDNNKKFFTWYYQILKNLCLNHIRDSKKTNNTDFIETIGDETESESPQFEIERVELENIVQKALLSLSDTDRELIILKEFQNISYKEMSELLNIPIGTVMSRLFYARKKLANKLRGTI
jgi:RNA polymerase sigma-70 factor (ECF subfamily)